MSEDTIDMKKEKAFNQIGEILMSLETEDMDGFEKTSHIFDVLEQLLARTIAGSSLTNEHIDTLSAESFAHIKELAKTFLREEMEEGMIETV